MLRLLPLAGALLLAPLVLSAQPTPLARSGIDADRDGVIDRKEAEAHPRLARHFDHLDRDRDGRLTADERPRHRSHGRRHGELERWDSDRDGRISRAEFDQAQAHRKRSFAPGQHAPKRAPLDFLALDTNRDGHVVRSEVHAYHDRQRPMREAERKARFEARFAKADINRDGRLSRLEVDEHLPRLADRFAWMDDNRDGQLSRQELQPQRFR